MIRPQQQHTAFIRNSKITVQVAGTSKILVGSLVGKDLSIVPAELGVPRVKNVRQIEQGHFVSRAGMHREHLDHATIGFLLSETMKRGIGFLELLA
jgi:hypothetical protein